MKALIAWWKDYNAAIEQHCREVCLQRDADRRLYLIWKGILK